MAMASLAAAAAVIHFVMVPSHMDEFSVEGVAFAVAGWLQLLVAFYLWTQPSRAILGFTILSNLGFIGRLGREPYGGPARRAELGHRRGGLGRRPHLRRPSKQA